MAQSASKTGKRSTRTAKAKKKATAKKGREAKSATRPKRSNAKSVAKKKSRGKGKAKVAGPDMGKLRTQIDKMDKQIVELINERASFASDIGKLKAKDGIKPYAPSRERAVYEKVERLNNGPLPESAFRAIYREVMSATIALERPTRVCHFGKAGSFTHLAARCKFGTSVKYVAVRDIRDVFMSVAGDRADYGLIPIENSTEGGVNQSIDVLAQTGLKICGEVYLGIHQNLLSQSKVKNIRVLYSHPQAFAQCRNWLNGHLGNIPRHEVGSTAEAAHLASKDKTAGAVAGVLAAEIYDVPVQAENIEDQQDNITRFFIIGERSADPTGDDKTSVVVSVGDEPGTLLKILMPFQRNKINLTRIESRPSKRRAWEYNFFIDLQGHAEDSGVKKTLNEIARKSRHLEILGSYPAAKRRVERPGSGQ